MKKLKITMISGVVLLLAFTLTASAIAQQRARVRQGLRAGIAQIIGAQQFIRGLQLTDTQKQDIKAILQSHKADILKAREAVLRARLALTNQAPNGPADFGAAQTQVMTLRQQILDEIKAKLTPDQLNMVQKRQQNQVERLEKALQNLQSREGV